MDIHTLNALEETLKDALLMIEKAKPEAQADAQVVADERERRRVANRATVQKVGTGVRATGQGVAPIGGSEAPRDDRPRP